MSYYIGIDGGGTKTDFLCVDSSGNSVASCRLGGTYYRQDGVGAVADILEKGVQTVTAGLERGAPSAIFFGMPGCGESPREDRAAVDFLRRRFPSGAFFADNDAAVGFAGAFAGGPGILIVGGTGSMSWGGDAGGRTARCGGWSEFFGDEGSGYWIGKKALELFSKESDGRAPRTEFYGMAREFFSLGPSDSDFALIGLVERSFAGSRSAVASLCPVLAEAAARGDRQAADIFAEAAQELAAIVCATRRRLELPEPVPISYVGGLFANYKLVLESLERLVSREFEAEFVKPRLSPCMGAVLLAARRLGDGALLSALGAAQYADGRKG